MRKSIALIIALGALIAWHAVGCSSSSPTAPSGSGGGSDGGDNPTILPPIPVPDGPNSILPATSQEVDAGLSNPISDFVPVVFRLERMQDDGSTAWTDENRHLWMVCGGRFSDFSCDTTMADCRYVTQAPRFLHQRYWRLVKQVVLDPGSGYSKAETIEYGSSTTDTQSQSFAQTVGVEVSASAGWGPFSATVTASYNQTKTSEEIKSVTFSQTSSFTDNYSVETDPNNIIVYGLWQLVDVFTLVDGDKTPIDQSPSLAHVTISQVPRVEFLNRKYVRQSVTKFAPGL